MPPRRNTHCEGIKHTQYNAGIPINCNTTTPVVTAGNPIFETSEAAATTTGAFISTSTGTTVEITSTLLPGSGIVTRRRYPSIASVLNQNQSINTNANTALSGASTAVGTIAAVVPQLPTVRKRASTKATSADSHQTQKTEDPTGVIWKYYPETLPAGKQNQYKYAPDRASRRALLAKWNKELFERNISRGLTPPAPGSEPPRASQRTQQPVIHYSLDMYARIALQPRWTTEPGDGKAPKGIFDRFRVYHEEAYQERWERRNVKRREEDNAPGANVYSGRRKNE